MEWFKFRMCWRKSLMLLSDEEAGKVIKALVNYVYSEDEQETGNVGDILLSLMTETMKSDLRLYKENAEKKAATSEKRKAAGRKSGEARRTKSENLTHVQLASTNVQQSPTSVQQPSTDVQAPEQVFDDVQVCSVLFDKNIEYKNTELKNQDTKNTEEIMTEKTEGKYSAAEEKNTSSCSEPPSADSELYIAENCRFAKENSVQQAKLPSRWEHDCP